MCPALRTLKTSHELTDMRILDQKYMWLAMVNIGVLCTQPDVTEDRQTCSSSKGFTVRGETDSWITTVEYTVQGTWHPTLLITKTCDLKLPESAGVTRSDAMHLGRNIYWLGMGKNSQVSLPSLGRTTHLLVTRISGATDVQYQHIKEGFDQCGPSGLRLKVLRWRNRDSVRLERAGRPE